MKKLALLSLLVFVVFSCSSSNDDDGGGGGTNGGGGTLPFLIMGNTTQASVSYNTDITNIDFEMTTQSGDSTFFEAGLDVDNNNSIDILFKLVTWTNNTVLTVRSSGYGITGSQDSFEIIGADTSFESILLFSSGTEINSSISGFKLDEDLLISHVLNGDLITVSQSVWSSVAYLPFTSALTTGWVGLNIVGTPDNIQGIGINTIATR